MNDTSTASPSDSNLWDGLSKYEYLYCCCLQGLLANGHPTLAEKDFMTLSEYARAAARYGIIQMNNPPTLDEIS